MTPRTRALFRRFRALLRSCGKYHLAPAKTRIAVMARVRFAGLNALSADSITISFALPHQLQSSRFVRVREVVPGWWGHWLRITEPQQLDSQVQRWLRQSYHLMGMQGRLTTPRTRAKRSRMPPN